MRPSNRRSQQPYVPPVPMQNGGEGYYIFVPKLTLPTIAGPSAPKRTTKRLKSIAQPLSSYSSGPPQPTQTFKDAAEEWFATNEERWVDKYRDRLRSRLDEDLISQLGNRSISDIRPLDVLAVIRKIEERGAIESAKRILNMASSVFRYGVATGQCSRDPTADIKGALRPPLPPKHRKALVASEIPPFMASLNAYDGDARTKLALQLLVLTFVRTGELRFSTWSEFENLDSPDALWRIPAERMKLRRPHLVPLSPAATTVLAALRKIPNKTPYLFPGPTRVGLMSENTMLFALYRMGYHSRATVHGFRATASTILNEAQFNKDWIEMQLAHRDGSIRGVYNFAEWLPGRRQMMTWWAEYLFRDAIGPGI